MERILLCSLLTLFPFFSFAGQSFYYLSADVGILKNDFNNTYRDQTDIIAQNISQPVSQQGYTGGIGLGYRDLQCQPFVFGAALTANIDTNRGSFQSGASSAAFSDQMKVNHRIDALLTPGILLTDSIQSYLNIGIAFASIEDTLNSPAGYNATMTTVKSNKIITGFTAGLGMTKALDKDFTLFVEANYHDYGTINFNRFQNFTATYTHSAHLYTYDVVIGLSYKIGAA